MSTWTKERTHEGTRERARTRAHRAFPAAVPARPAAKASAPAARQSGRRKTREKAARSAVSAARRAAHLAAPVPPEPASEVGARRPAGRPPLPSRPGVSELLGRTARTGAGQAPAARTVTCSPLGWQHLGTGHRCRGHRGTVWLDGVSGDRPSPLNACCDPWPEAQWTEHRAAARPLGWSPQG